MHRAGPPAACDVKRLRHHLGYVFDFFDTRAPLGDFFEHLVHERRIIDAVKRLHVGVQRHGTGEMHHRRGRAIGLPDARHGIDAARPGGDHAHARFAGEAPVRIRHQRGVGLLLAHHEADRLDFAQAVVNRMNVRAGHAEHARDTFFAQRFRHGFAGVQGFVAHERSVFISI